MIARTTALVFLSTIVATSMAAVCPLDRPNATVACDFRNQDCRYGEDGCQQDGFVYQCRCATAGDPFVCSCRGDLGATPTATTTATKDVGSDTDVESLEVEDYSGAASATAFASSIALLGGMFALL